MICTPQKRILFLGKTVSGSQHDYSLFKQEFPPTKKWFKGLKVKLDSGYTGFKKDYECKRAAMPVKKPYRTKNNPSATLSEKDKLFNKKLSAERVIVEHSIGGMKRYRILKNTSRTKNILAIDHQILLCAALWNFYLQGAA